MVNLAHAAAPHLSEDKDGEREGRGGAIIGSQRFAA
jgi:hypothetical protein